MKECSKSIARRLADSNFTRRYFVGDGIDIGGKPDPLALYREFFCQMHSARTWDKEDGDAQEMAGVADGSYDFVHSSHCLEHLANPIEGLRNWLRIVREGGHLVITVPDEDLYEQGVFPSTFNLDHKWSFCVNKHESWSAHSLCVLDLVRELGPLAELVKLELLLSTFRFNLPRYDQTLSPVGECGIEFIIRKRTAMEMRDRGRWRRPGEQPGGELRIHLNQYRDDLQTLKRNNQAFPPFENDADV